MSIRSANATIKGYVYQFDDTIIRILNSSNRQSVLVEGIEDVDIEYGNTSEAIQCKYLPSKKYSLASIRDAILPMLHDFLDRVRRRRQKIHYRLFAYFSDISPGEILLDLQSAKQCLIKKKKDDTVINYQNDYGASDSELGRFLTFLTIEIATEYNRHKDDVFEVIKQEYSCDDAEIEFYYNNALSLVAQMASESEESDRRITKQRFLQNTNNKETLYSIWRLQEIGKIKYCKEIRRQHFSIRNISPYARFFIMELKGNETRPIIKDVLLEIRKKWSSHERKRKPEQERYAPYICIRGISHNLMVEIKNELYNEGIKFSDGFAFSGSDFNLDELNKRQTYENQLSLRFINDDKLITQVIDSLNCQTKEVYQFYKDKPLEITHDIKNVIIKVDDISYIREII